MKKIYSFTIFAISAIALISCTKEQQAVPESEGEIRFNISLPGTTKATATQFENGDAISLYAVEYNGGVQMPLQIGGNLINNEKITFNGAAWTGVRKLYWGANACDFYALYPYMASITSVEELPFSLSPDQSGDGYEASDLLFASVDSVSKADGTVDLRFKHMLSKLVVKIEKGSKFEGEIPDDIVAHIYNTNVDCTVNLTIGSVTKNAFGAKKIITMRKLSNERFEAVVVPQNLEKKTPLIELTMGGIAYLLEYSLSFRPGYVHTVTVTLNTSPDQEQIEISIDPNVNNWN